MKPAKHSEESRIAGSASELSGRDDVGLFTFQCLPELGWEHLDRCLKRCLLSYPLLPLNLARHSNSQSRPDRPRSLHHLRIHPRPAPASGRHRALLRARGPSRRPSTTAMLHCRARCLPHPPRRHRGNDYNYESYLGPFIEKLANTTLTWTNTSAALAFFSTWTPPIAEKDVELLTRAGKLEAYTLGLDLSFRYPSLCLPQRV